MNCCAGRSGGAAWIVAASQALLNVQTCTAVLARVTEGVNTLFPAARTRVLTGLAKRLKRAAQGETQGNEEIKVILAVTGCNSPVCAPRRDSKAVPTVLFACNRLRKGVNRKLKWLVQGGNGQQDDSNLPRLLTDVYTPLLRCATASDVGNFARGLKISERGASIRFPVLHFWGLASNARTSATTHRASPC